MLTRVVYSNVVSYVTIAPNRTVRKRVAKLKWGLNMKETVRVSCTHCKGTGLCDNPRCALCSGTCAFCDGDGYYEEEIEKGEEND